MAGEQDRAFEAELRRQLERLPQLVGDTHDAIAKLLAEAEQRITAVLAGQPSDYQRWSLPPLLAQIRRALDVFGEGAVGVAGAAAGQAFQLGQDLIEKPLEAGFAAGPTPAALRLDARLPMLDARQLVAIRAFMVDRLRNVSVAAASRIGSELGLVVIGAQSPSQAIEAVQGVMEGIPRSRARTIVNTEVGRAYSVASQGRMEQARLIVPGLQKQWRRSSKFHFRPSHHVADGQVQDVDEPFLVGGVPLMMPRDPKADAKDTVNCGCTSLPYNKSWTMLHPQAKPYSERELASPSARQVQQIRDSL